MLNALDSTSILLVGAILLAGGALGMLVIRISSPRLLGLGWLVGAFLSGGCGALLLVGYGVLPRFFGVVLSDLSILLAFVLLHVSILEMRKAQRIFPVLGAVLLSVQLLGYLWMTFVHPNGRGRIGLVGLMVSTQVIQTAFLLIKGAKPGLRMPAWFTAMLLIGFIGVNLMRTGLLYVPGGLSRVWSLNLEKITFLVYVATAMGIGFNFFWMTTAELSSELERMASTDPLTRIYNRRVFRDWCEREITLSRRSGVPFSVLMMDLDHFKSINDRFGHRGGDEMLCAVVEKMQDSVRGIDVLGRWGGEEFVALLPGAKAEAALIVAQRVRTHIEQMTLPGKNGEAAMRMTVSLGVATYRGVEDDLDDMFHRADEALYRAKAQGRNRALYTV